jgi:hypothetical protein
VVALRGGPVVAVVRCAGCFTFTGVYVRGPVPWARLCSKVWSTGAGVVPVAVRCRIRSETGVSYAATVQALAWEGFMDALDAEGL